MRVFSMVIALWVLFALFTDTRGQDGARAVTLDQTIVKAAEQRVKYITEFKNLLSQESKTIAIFDKKGSVKKTRTIVSTFIVYQLSRDEKSIAEYRNVVTVDGRKIEDADKRAEDFFERITKLDSSLKELEKLEGEGSRFDEEISINGFTLYQAAPLADNIRPSITFRFEREDVVSGSAVYVISYVQSKQSPYIISRGQRPTGDGNLTLRYDTGMDENDAAIRLNGELWIDKVSFQVRREKRNLTVLPEGWSSPVVLAETVLNYENSDFGILIPKLIEHTTFDIKKKEKTSAKESKITFVYDKFTKPDVEVKSSEVKERS
ncbi:MAG: hypothetical protein ABIU09_07820 [Pyrinomonadaceae bacterium]